jgi:hypothetical protein
MSEKRKVSGAQFQKKAKERGEKARPVVEDSNNWFIIPIEK